MRLNSVWSLLGFITLLSFAPKAQADWISLSSNIQIDIDQQMVKLPLEVINHSGGLEFIITIGKVKDYESVFGVECAAKEIHLAMATVGFEPQGYLDLKSPDYQAPKTQLDLLVEIEGKKNKLSHYIAWNGDKPIQDMGFYFCGSFFQKMGEKNHYAADLGLSIVAAYPSKEMLIGPLVSVANPYQEEEGAYLIPHKNVLPPIGTRGWLFIQKRSK